MRDDSPRQPAPKGMLGAQSDSKDEDSTAQAIRTMFAAVAPRYDLLNHALSLGRDIAWRSATARALRSVLERPGSVVVDLCCGTGDLSLAFARYSGGIVIGADFCHPMLQLARRKARLMGDVIFLEADALRLPLRDESADAVAIAFGFRNLANYDRGVQEMWRILRRGAELAILEFSRVRGPAYGPLFHFYFHHLLPWLGTWISGIKGPYQYLADSVSRFPDQEALAAFLREAGFQQVRYKNLTGGIAALHLAVKP